MKEGQTITANDMKIKMNCNLKKSDSFELIKRMYLLRENESLDREEKEAQLKKILEECME